MKKSYIKPEVENIGSLPKDVMLPDSVDGNGNRLPTINSEWTGVGRTNSVELDISLDNNMWDD